jgi:hypothetical protein
MDISLTQRDFSGPAREEALLWEVQRLEWRAVGGPRTARLKARAGRGQAALGQLWALAGLLRYGITISDQGPAWWGFIETVELHWVARVARISLDELWNRCAVEFFEYNPAIPNGTRGLTSILSDAGSIGAYGYKERIFRAEHFMTPTQAAAYAATMLNQRSLPAQSVQVDPAGVNETEPYAVVTCRGWWETLNWRFYNDGRGRIGNTTGGTRVVIQAPLSGCAWAEDFAAGAVGWSASEVWIKLAKVGYPVDNIKLDLCANSGGVPGGSLATGQVWGAAVSQELDWCKVTLNAPVALTANSTYFLQITRTGVTDAVNYYVLGADASGGWAGGRLIFKTTGAWGVYVPESDLAFLVIGYQDNGALMGRILDGSLGCGQFLSGYRVEAAIGVESPLYHDGSTRGRDELEELLKTGTSAGVRLLATVTPARLARVYTQPAAPAPGKCRLAVGPRGELAHIDGSRLMVSEWPAGQWARLGELAASSSVLGYGGSVFIEGCYWDGATMKVSR